MDGGLTRREVLERSGRAALGSAGIYGLLGRWAAAPARAAAVAGPRPPEQHLLRGLAVVRDEGVRVVVPPLHHQIVTAKVQAGPGRAALIEARRELEAALADVERELPDTPAGLGICVAWGLPYFRRLVPVLADGRRFPEYLPRDLQASRARRRAVPAVLDAVRFESDPPETILEANDVAILLRSDVPAHVTDTSAALFDRLGGMFAPTSIRRGFVGGGFGGRTSLPKAMATAAGVPGADLIPEDAQLFLGFTSTQEAGLGPDRITNFETLPGLTDQWPRGYFRHGTTLALSHIDEDLERWYTTFPFGTRLWRMYDLSRLNLAAGTQTLPVGPNDVQSEADLRRFAVDASDGGVGHGGAIETANRLPAAVRDNYGTLRPRGTPILLRVDFNTLDNPFFWSARPRRDGVAEVPSAGVHFAAFSPTSDLFHRMRRAMDGRLPSGPRLPIDPGSERMGINAVLRTTHRQNFLVPPRAHRSFPLAELL